MPIPIGTNVTAGVDGFYEVKPDEVISLANRTEEIAFALETDFRQAKLAPSTFAGFEVGDEMVEAHAAAHAIMVSTYEGVVTDLVDFADSLQLAVTDAQQVDDLNQQQLLQISEIAAGGNAERNQEAARANLLGYDEEGHVGLRDDDA